MKTSVAIFVLVVAAADALHMKISDDPKHLGSEIKNIRDLFSDEAQKSFAHSTDNGTVGEDVLERHRQRQRQGPTEPDRSHGHPLHKIPKNGTLVCDIKKTTPKRFCAGNSSMRTSAVVVSTYWEDLRWLSNHKGPITIYVHNRTQSNYQGLGWPEAAIRLARQSEGILLENNDNRSHPIEFVHIPNVGDEAAGYLEYITTHWDTLPDIMFFIHGHQCSAHQSFDMLKAMHDIKNCFSEHQGYLDLNNIVSHPVCYWGLNKGRKQPPSVESKIEHLKKMWPILFEKQLGRIRNTWCMDLRAQFVVTRDRIKSYPHDFYEQALMSVIYGQTSFEYFWRMLFTPTIKRAPS